MRLIFKLSCCFFLQAIPLVAQDIFVPDRDENLTLNGRDIRSISYFGIEQLDDEVLILKPSLKQGWRWIAAKNIPYAKGTFNLFIHDGYIYTDFKGRIRSNFRRAKSRKNLTEQVRSNVFHLAFLSGEGKDEEVFVFIATDKATRATLQIDSAIFGERKQFEYDLADREARLLRIINGKNMPEWQPMFFEREKPLRQKMDFTQRWRFKKGSLANAAQPELNDAAWEQVSLPHSWNRTDMYDNRNFNDGLDIYTNYWRGDGWYRKTFVPPSEAKGKKLWIEFEAANQTATVYLNGKLVGNHIGGYLTFKFDITDKVIYGKPNVIAVKVNNDFSVDIPPHVGDFNFGGGLTREASLIITPSTYLASSKLTTPLVRHDSASLSATTVICNDANLSSLHLVTNLISPDGFIVASSVAPIQTTEKRTTVIQHLKPIAYPHLWSPETPTLYRVVQTLYENERAIDETTTYIGFRFYDFNADSGFFLNGKRLQLRGVNLHQDRFGYGHAVPDSLKVQDVRLFKEMGCNFIRLAHYPHDESVLDECDRLGVIVYAEIPFVNTVGREKFFTNTKAMLKEMIQRDWNHPSIIFWGVANETVEPWIRDEDLMLVRKLVGELHQIAKAEDPSRITIQAQNTIADTLTASITDALGRNRYSGWYSKRIEDFGKQLDMDRKAHPEWRVLISEYGADAKRGFHVEKPERMDFSETYQVVFHESYLKQIESRPWIAGGAVWNGADFASHAKMGNIPRINEKGLVDYKRIPKDAYYFYQSRWTQKPMVYLVSHTRQVMIGKPNEVKAIRAFSNCDSVKLFHNGKSLGTQTKDFLWKTTMNEGDHHFEAHAFKDGRLVKDAIRFRYVLEKTSSSINLNATEADATRK